MYSFHVKVGDFLKAGRPASLRNVFHFSFCISLSETEILTDLLMEHKCGGESKYDLHVMCPLAVHRYTAAAGYSLEKARLIEVQDREGFCNLNTKLRDIPAESEMTIQIFEGKENQQIEQLRVIVTDANVTATLPALEVKELDEEAPHVDDYDMEFADGALLYDSEDPEEVLFFSKRVQGFWIATTLTEAGSVKELNQVLCFIESGAAEPIEGETYTMGKARKGRRTATPSAPPPATTPAAPPAALPVEPPAAPPAAPPVEPPAPQVEPPVEPPVAPPVEPPVDPPAPETTDAPPVEAPKKKGRRSKEEIRQDEIDAAFAILTRDQDAEDVVGILDTFCKEVLVSHGYDVDKVSTEEATTLAEQLEQAADTLDTLSGKLSSVKDQVRAAQACSDGLYTKEDLLAKLTAGL